MLVKKIIILPCLILACVSLTGCLGIGLVVVHPRQKCSVLFELGNRGEVGKGDYVTHLTEAKLLELWGQPDSKHNEEDGEIVWRYQGRYIAGAIVPMFLIPVPIPFPAGHKYVEIYFKDGIAQKLSQTVDVFSGAAMGPGKRGYILELGQEDTLGNSR